MVCYADDLAVVATADTKGDLMLKVNDTLMEIEGWMRTNKLEVAPEKTQAVLLNRMRREEEVRFNMGGVEIRPGEAVEYLGLVVDWGPIFGRHVRKAVEKAGKLAKALGALLPNVRGPSEGKRRVMYAAVESTVLYASPIWHAAVKMQWYRDLLASTQRMMALRICRAYKTASNEAIFAVSGTIPLHLMVQERTRIFDRVDEAGAAKEERMRTMARWQEEWDTGQKGRWTWRLIRNIERWRDRKHGEVSYWVTQCLTDHGCFNKYLAGIGKREDGSCSHCVIQEDDDAEHTLFRCPSWRNERYNINARVQVTLSPLNLIDTMLRSNEDWGSISEYIQKIMSQKERDDRRGNLV